MSFERLASFFNIPVLNEFQLISSTDFSSYTPLSSFCLGFIYRILKTRESEISSLIFSSFHQEFLQNYLPFFKEYSSIFEEETFSEKSQSFLDEIAKLIQKGEMLSNSTIQWLTRNQELMDYITRVTLFRKLDAEPNRKATREDRRALLNEEFTLKKKHFKYLNEGFNVNISLFLENSKAAQPILFSGGIFGDSFSISFLFDSEKKLRILEKDENEEFIQNRKQILKLGDVLLENLHVLEQIVSKPFLEEISSTTENIKKILNNIYLRLKNQTDVVFNHREEISGDEVVEKQKIDGNLKKKEEEELSEYDLIDHDPKSERMIRCCPNCFELYVVVGDPHVTCLKCKTEFCFECSSLREPIRQHGHHFHRKGCSYYIEKPEKYEDKLKKNCTECSKNGKKCSPPEDLESYYKRLNFGVKIEL